MVLARSKIIWEDKAPNSKPLPCGQTPILYKPITLSIIAYDLEKLVNLDSGFRQVDLQCHLLSHENVRVSRLREKRLKDV